MGFFGNSQTDDASSSMANQTRTQDQVNLVGEGTVFEGSVRGK
jgi:hypothetical protein